MKAINKNIFIMALGIASMSLLSSCQSEAPFSTEGEGLVTLNVEVNSRVTRAVEGEAELRKNARIYISENDKVLHKWVGVKNIPEHIYLRYGSYKAEAMAGTYSLASFTDKYFEGSTDFTVGSDAATTSVSITCKIANVVASVDENSINANYVQNLKVNIGHSKENLDFAGETIMKPGYFMMPKDETDLSYTVTGEDKSGKAFTKTGKIEDVQPAHNYKLKFSYNPSESNDGGAFITISIQDENLLEDDVVIYGRPAFSWLDNNPDIDSQIIGTPGSFTDKVLRVAAHNGFSSLMIKTSNPELTNALGGSEFELVDMSETGINGLASRGIEFEARPSGNDNLGRYYITFKAGLLNSLPLSEDPEAYVLEVKAVDKSTSNKTKTQLVRIANTEKAIVYSDPVIIEFDLSKDLTLVSARSATVPYSIKDESIANPKIQYRTKGSTDWTNEQALVSTKAGSVLNVKLTGLNPETAYEMRAVAGEVTDGKYEFESDDIFEFTTESIFVIPNASMEDWSNFIENDKVLLPGAGGQRTFWDSGNHGSATMDVTLTNKSNDMFHKGEKSAKLRSQYVGLGGLLGKFAAGNLFAGEYLETQGTDGRLSFGRPYNGSHPSALKLWVNYQPGKVQSNGKGDYLAEGATDQAQIYVALSTSPVEVRTKKKDRKLFNPEDPEILAYGQVTWKEAFGADGQLQEVNIPLTYYDRAKTTKPLYLVIVCSASKYGDYFNGGEGSTLYVDDFELVYE